MQAFSQKRAMLAFRSPGTTNLQGPVAGANADRKRIERAARAVIQLLERRVLLSSVVVNSTSDTATGTGIVTLRDAITTADSSTTPTTITFDPTAFAAAQTITLSGTQLLLSNTTEATTITGPAAGVTISGNGASRIFKVNSGVTATMSGLTFTGGYAFAANPGDRGGAIENVGNLKVSNSLFEDNQAKSFGGAINEDYPGNLTLINDTLTENTVIGPAPSGNGSGGAISVAGEVTLDDDTITGNSAPGYGGINANPASGEPFTLSNTIVAGNTETIAGTGDAYGGYTSDGHNLIGDIGPSTGWISSDQTGTSAAQLSAELGTLANNGGPTQTILPLTGSPVIDAGSVALIPSGVTTDQRGDPRTIDGTVDIGAVEVGGTAANHLVVNSTSDTATGAGIVTLRNAITTADSSSTPSTITFDPTVFAAAQTIVLDGTTLTLSNTTEPTTIVGPANGVAISGNGLSRIFSINSGVTISMTDVTLEHGAATISGGIDRGGAVQNSGALTIIDSLLIDNTALSYGGAIDEGGGSVTLINDTLTGNVVTGPASNPSGLGSGGAMSIYGYATLDDDTITGNTAPVHGGISVNNGLGDPFDLANTIVAGNVETESGSGDAGGTFVSQGHNLIGNINSSSGWISSDLTGTNSSPLSADLGTLANNGGPTQTILPLAGSPALGAGSVALIPSGITTDQRGDARTINGKVDIGAVELGTSTSTGTATTTVLTTSPTMIANGGSITLTATVTTANTSAGTIGGTVNFYQAGALIGSATLQSNGTAVLSTTALAAGDDSLAATFVPGTGSAYAGSSSASVLVTVTVGTTITLTTSQSRALVGEGITLTATVVAVVTVGSTPGGTVEFFNGTTLLGTGLIGSDGQAVLALLAGSSITATAGSYSLTAVYVGQDVYTGSTSPVVIQVVEAPTSSVTVTITGGTLELGETVTYTATIISLVPGLPAPTGTVLFSSGGTLLGVEPVLANGTAVLIITTLPAGSDPVTVVYSGDANYTPSVPVIQPVVVYQPGVLPVVPTGVLPGTFIAGYTSRLVLTITISNPTTTLVQGRTTINIYGSLNGVIDSNSILLKSFTGIRIRIPAGKTEGIRLVFILPLTLLAGNYTLLFGVGTLATAGVFNYAPTGPTLIVVDPVTRLTGPVMPVHVDKPFIATQKASAQAKLSITNGGNVTSTGPTSFMITASPTAGEVGTELATLKLNLAIRAGKSRTVVLPVSQFPLLPAGSYYLVVQVTDPRGNVTLFTSSSLVTVEAPVVTLTAAFAPNSTRVYTSGAYVTITNSGNIDDLSVFNVAAGFATNADGSGPVANASGQTITTKIRVRAGRSVRVHINAWASIAADLTAGVAYYATLTLTDSNGNTAFAVNPVATVKGG